MFFNSVMLFTCYMYLVTEICILFFSELVQSHVYSVHTVPTAFLLLSLFYIGLNYQTSTTVQATQLASCQMHSIQKQNCIQKQAEATLE